jgi:hypothetical protein
MSNRAVEKAIPMTQEMDEEIKELCKQVVAEENSKKLLELIGPP